MTISDCASHCNLSSPTVIKILNEFGIERYTKVQIYNPNLDEEYFKIIDNEHKAYWLGFLITDGNIFEDKKSNRQKSISISQSDDREYILQTFLNDLNANTSIGHDGRGTSFVAIRSNKMANDLKQHGVVPQKTLHTFLPNINNNLLNHLLRGILDGDGNITSTITKENKHKHAISFCGTNQLMNDISNVIFQILSIEKPKIYDYKNKHLSEIKYQSIKDCSTIGDWLYKDSTIYINEKREKFINFIDHYNLKKIS
jgi:hypothetical protein